MSREEQNKVHHSGTHTKVEVRSFFLQVPLVLVSWFPFPFSGMLNSPLTFYSGVEAPRTSLRGPVLGTKPRGAPGCWGGTK